MSKTYFELDVQGKKALANKQPDRRPDTFAASTTVAETTTIAPQVEEEQEEAETN